MATKKDVKEAPEKAEKPVKEKKSKAASAKYFYAVGRRKTAIAQARLYPEDKATENDVVVNDRKLKDFFPTIVLQNIFTAPFRAVGATSKFKVSILVKGGGTKAQAEAARLAVSRALVKSDEELRKTLRDMGFLTRDSREVERKKPGLKKARRAPQWKKR